MTRGQHPLAALSLIAALLAVFTGCSREAQRKAPAPRPSVPVTVARAFQTNVPVEIPSIGNVQPVSFVTVRPQVTGKIQRVHFTEGQDVKAGDLLVTLDPSSWQAAVNQAKANLKRDEAQLLSARLEFQRTSNLFASKIASEQDYQTAEATFMAAESLVQADLAALSNAMVSLDYTEIRAPIDGRTGALAVKAGNVVKAPDDAVVTITTLRPAEVAFGIPEQHLLAIRQQAAKNVIAVRAFASSHRSAVAQGVLTFIDNSVNMTTGTILLKARFENSDLVLWPGQFVETVLTLSNLVDVVVVPTPAVQNGQKGEFVFVVNSDSIAEMRPVKTSVAHAGFTAIMDGVSHGETVITDGHLRVTPGGKVTIKSASDERPAEGSSLNP